MSTALDDLRAENAALVARVSALEARERDRTASVERSAPLGGVVAPVRRELQITYLPPDPGQFVMPTEEELRQLLPIVLDQHPELRPNLGRHSLSGDPEADYFAEFCAAFRRIGFLGRLDAPNRKFYLDHWIDEARRMAPPTTDARRHVRRTISGGGNGPWRRLLYPGRQHRPRVGGGTSALGRAAGGRGLARCARDREATRADARPVWPAGPRAEVRFG